MALQSAAIYWGVCLQIPDILTWNLPHGLYYTCFWELGPSRVEGRTRAVESFIPGPDTHISSHCTTRVKGSAKDFSNSVWRPCSQNIEYQANITMNSWIIGCRFITKWEIIWRKLISLMKFRLARSTSVVFYVELVSCIFLVKLYHISHFYIYQCIKQNS